MSEPVLTPTRGPLPAARVRELSQRSSWMGALQLGSHLMALALSGTALAWAWGSWWALPLWAVHGVLLNYTYAAQHELSHNTVFASRRANALWGRFFGFLNLYPRDYDRHHHLRHHRHTGDPDQDAELAFRTPYTLGSYLLYLLGPSYWWGRVRAIVGCALGRFGAYPLPPDVHRRLAREAQVHLLLYAVLAALSLWLGSSWLLILWLGPLLTMRWAHNLQNTVEHTGMDEVPDLLRSTRTVRAGPVWRWLGWQMAFHTAHHAYPSVPFHRLAELHQSLLDARAKPVEVGYWQFQRDVLVRLARGERL